MKQLTKKVTELRESKNLSQTEMAEKMKISLRTYQRFEADPKKDMTKIEKFASLFDMTAEELMGWSAGSINDPGYNSNQVEIPIVKIQAGAGEGIYNYEEQGSLLSLNTSLFPFAQNCNCTAVEIIGDSMEPDYRSGDYIIVTPVNGDRRDDGVYAIRVDGMLKVKQLQFKLDGSIDIISINKNYPTETYIPRETQVDFDIIGSKKIHISR